MNQIEKKSSKYLTLFRDMIREWKWLFRYIKRYWWSVLIYIIIGIAGTSLGLGVSVATKFLIDSVITQIKSELMNSAILLIGFAVGQIIINAASERISSLISLKISNEIRADIFDHILYADWEDLCEYHSGELLNRLEGDVTSVSSGVISFLPNLVTRGTQFIGALCIVLYYDKVMALLALLSAPVIIFTSRFMMRMIRKYNKESRELNGKILSYSEESFQNIQTVKAFGLIKTYSKNLKNLLTEYRNIRLSHDKFTILMRMCLSLVGLIVFYSCYGWGVWQLWQGIITYGTMTLFIQLSGTLTASFSVLVGMAPSAVSIATSAGRIMELTSLSTESEIDEEQVNNMLSEIEKTTIRLIAESVTFKYKKTEIPALNRVDFHVMSGEIIALVGSSGGGKTTILRLLLGLIKLDEGEIRIETVDGLTMIISENTRRLFSYVPQGNSMFSGTIEQNLRIIKSDATEQELINALKIADAWEFIKDLPDGINTVVGERGVNFSEGQSQRLAIARALLRDAPILLLDEATSALDFDTESRVLKNLMQANPKRICILTTHRPSMLKYCDRIYTIDEQGNLYEPNYKS